MNTSREEIKAFRQQIQAVDMIGCEDLEILAEKIKGIYNNLPNTPLKNDHIMLPVELSATETVKAQVKKPEEIKLDHAGYFVIIPNPQNGVITAEHYTYQNQLLRIIEGHDARNIYLTIIENNWVSDLSHAAYLGKELARAELSIKSGAKYIQDGA